MQRRVEPEILDTLPPDDPQARASRRDLRLLNGIMGNHRWLLRRLRAALRPGGRVLELGAGDGTLGKRLVQTGHVSPEALHAIDLAPRPPDWPSAAHWHQRDVLAGDLPEAEVVVANLFLHHFEEQALKQLGAAIRASCRVLLCSEPARRRCHVWQGNWLGVFFPLSRVTRHDMPVSIRAGFLGDDLPHLLGLSGWKVAVSTTFFGAYRLEAHRL